MTAGRRNDTVYGANRALRIRGATLAPDGRRLPTEVTRMHESTRRARERIIATEVMKLEWRQAVVRSQRRAGASTLSQTSRHPGAMTAGSRKGHR